MQKKELACASAPVFDTYALAVCALLTALSVVLARLLTVIPSEVSRFSLEAVPILLAGLLFGALPGGAVGFSADLIGCLFSPYGYNPIFCLPPILYGVWAGIMHGTCGESPPCGAWPWRCSPPPSPGRCCGRAWRWRWCTAVRRRCRSS